MSHFATSSLNKLFVLEEYFRYFVVEDILEVHSKLLELKPAF